jgi:hypothetical protein
MLALEKLRRLVSKAIVSLRMEYCLNSNFHPRKVILTPRSSSMHLIGYFPLLHKANTWLINYFVQYLWNRVPPFVTKRLFFTIRSKEGRRSTKDSVFEVCQKVSLELEYSLANYHSAAQWAMKEIQARFQRKELPSHPTDIADKLFQIRSEKGALKTPWLVTCA